MAARYNKFQPEEEEDKAGTLQIRPKKSGVFFVFSGRFINVDFHIFFEPRRQNHEFGN